jgi:hypothetical protein
VSPRRVDAGAAVVDFVLVGAVLTLMFAALLQLGLALHVRNVLKDCATEGARYGALADRSPAAGAQRTRDLIAADLSDGYTRDVDAQRESIDGLDSIVVRVRAPLPVVGLIGLGRTVSATGHAVAETP